MSISCSYAHGLAIDTEGRVWSWGTRAIGRAGLPEYPELVGGALQGKKIVCVAAGRSHSMAVSEDGKLYSWGEGSEGALGLGGKKDESSPCEVNIPGDRKAAKVSCGDGSSIICTEDGAVFTCGSSDFGQAGLGKPPVDFLSFVGI